MPAATSTYREWVKPDQADVVQCWWEQKVTDGQGYVQRVLPDGCSDVIVSVDGEATVVGPSMSVALPQLGPGAHLRAVRFRTEALATVLHCPGPELRDATLPLSAVVSDRLARQIAEGVWEQRLPDQLGSALVDSRVQFAVSRLRLSNGQDAAAVAVELGLSERHLRRLLIEHTGVGPRSLQRVARLQRFLRLADVQWPSVSLAGLAAAAGYADQAHLTRDVRELAGITPLSLLRERAPNRTVSSVNGLPMP